MYYAHFGLTQAPFKITPNTEFFFSGGNRGPVLEALLYAISDGEGIVKVTGEVGSGKTMLCSMLQTRLPAHIETVYLANPSVSPEEILHAIAFELQLGVDRAAGRLETMHALQDYMVRRHAEGRRVVIFIEESQSMPIATLEEIRLLSNLETASDKLLQIVLFGQPELDDNLRQPHIRQLRERITHSFRLEPLRTDEVREYLMFRMRAAGYHGPELFPASVVKLIAQASAGLTRRINLIAEKTLLGAFAENTHTIRLKHVQAAVRDSEFSQTAPVAAGRSWLVGAGLVLAGAVIGISLYAGFGPPIRPPAAEPAAAAPQQTVAPTGVPSEGSPTTSVTAPAEPVADGAQTAGTTPAPAVPETATPVTTAATGSRPGNLIAARLAVTEEWLARQPASTYSIQLLGAADEQQLNNHLNIIVKSIEINEIFVYRTLAKGSPSLTVLYGSYSDRRAAQDALAKLPAQLKSNRPLVRTVQGIRAEIRQNQGS